LKKLVFIFFFYFNYSHAYDIYCNFEEVYHDSNTQNGFLLIKNDKVRYEYFDEKLYTIVSNGKNVYLIHNMDTEIVRKIDKNSNYFDTVMNILKNFPINENSYTDGDLIIRVEKNTNNFYKRISIKSDNLKLSIHFYDCEYLKIDDKYFRHFNFIKYEK